jgi:hypothetical protein
LHVAERLVVVVGRAALRVGDEHHRVGAGEDDPPGRLVDHLARHGEQLELDLEAGLGLEAHRQQIEEQGAVALGVEGGELAPAGGVQQAEQRLQVGRLPGQRWAVVDDLQRQFALCGVELHPMISPSVE